MNTHRDPRVNRKTAENLLRGVPGGPESLSSLLATAVATAATGGVALAAATNTLPEPVQGAAHNVFNAPAPRHHGKPNDVPGRGNQPGAKPSGAPGTPSPSLRGLCTAFQAGATSNHGKALTNPAFTALVTAAGGTDKL